jgi:putative PIN family toxin of toxin-antitoxin system
MRLVVDTNVIISSLIKDGVSRRLLTHSTEEFLTIAFSAKEVEKYAEEICKKAKITSDEFEAVLEKILEHLVVIDDKIIMLKMEEAKKIMDEIDPKDTFFIAAALATKSSILSDDKHFQQQKRVKVVTTKELVRKYTNL